MERLTNEKWQEIKKELGIDDLPDSQESLSDKELSHFLVLADGIPCSVFRSSIYLAMLRGRTFRNIFGVIVINCYENPREAAKLVPVIVKMFFVSDQDEYKPLLSLCSFEEAVSARDAYLKWYIKFVQHFSAHLLDLHSTDDDFTRVPKMDTNEVFAAMETLFQKSPSILNEIKEVDLYSKILNVVAELEATIKIKMSAWPSKMQNVAREIGRMSGEVISGEINSTDRTICLSCRDRLLTILKKYTKSAPETADSFARGILTRVRRRAGITDLVERILNGANILPFLPEK